MDGINQRHFPAETTVRRSIPQIIRLRFRTSGCGIGGHFRTRCARFKHSHLYDFPDIDIDRYDIDGTTREVMLAARELNVDKLPEKAVTGSTRS